jgi:hypothetical protein
LRKYPQNCGFIPFCRSEYLATCNASSATQCRLNPVSGRNLPKRGIFRVSAGDYRLFCPENGQNWTLETVGLIRKSPPLAGFYAGIRGTFSDPDCLAGDAVLIAPVSRRIPCKQGILQGNPQFWGLRRQYRHRKPLSRSDFSSISLDRLTGKITQGTANPDDVSGN